ncbi:MAG: hypothetical protein GXO18_00040 [Aquificae bacterium]|nr:hypothetical protein [Aquificota bacterium]
MNKEGLRERKAYYEKLLGWLLTGFLALIGGLSGLLIGGIEGIKLLIFIMGLLALPAFFSAILVLHFSIIDIIKKLEEDDGP